MIPLVQIRQNILSGGNAILEHQVWVLLHTDEGMKEKTWRQSVDGPYKSVVSKRMQIVILGAQEPVEGGIMI